MAESFTAILSKDGVRWIGAAPPALAEGEEVVADVFVRETPAPLPGPGWDGRELAALLRRIAEQGAFDGIEDPASWERDLREERDL